MINKIRYDSREPNLEVRYESVVTNQPIPTPWWQRKFMIALVLVAILIVIGVFLFLFTPTSRSPSYPEDKPEEIDLPHLLDQATKHIGIDPTGNGAVHESACEHLPNDILSMTRGIDITKLDLSPTTVEGLKNNPGFVRQVVKLTCNYNYVKRDSNGIPLVRLPDQVKPTGYEIISGLVFSKEYSRHTQKHSLDVKTQMAADVGISVFLVGMFSASASYKDKRNSFISKKASFIQSKISILTRRINFSKRPSTTILDPDDDFLALIEKLPNGFSSNPNGYLEAIRQFGTHFFVSAQFGGFIQNSTEYTERAQDSASNTQFDGTASAGVKRKLVAARVGVSGGHSHTESQNQASETAFTKKFVNGGSIPLGYSGDLEKWIESVERSPTVFSGLLVPISTLIQDEAKAKAFDLATQVFLGQAYVKDLRETLEILIEDRQGTNLSKIIAMLKSVKNQSTDIKGLSNPKILEALEKDVTALINSAPIPISTIHRRGYATIIIIEATLPPAKGFGLSRGTYVETSVLKSSGVAIKYHTTRTHHRVMFNRNKNPSWNEAFTVPVELDETVQFCVYDSNGSLLKFLPTEGCFGMTIREIVDRKLNGTPTAFLYYGSTMELTAQVTWYQR